ncbi:HNH endonuclease [Chroococcidiopsis cubana]|uniref:HNH endonuclease n=1 Tax=Chroococcidiopsis cubana TaxID=171392 RepID=UPI001C62BD76
MTSRLAAARKLAFIAQDRHCFYCGVPMWQSQSDELPSSNKIPKGIAAGLRCTAEHLTAKQDGGTDCPSNIVAACLTCNRRRHARKVPPPPDMYRSLVCKGLARRKWHNPELFKLGLVSALPNATAQL